MTIRRLAYLALAASLTLSGCSASGNTSSDFDDSAMSVEADSYVDSVTEANRETVESACTLVTSAYNSWKILGASSSTIGGKKARDAVVSDLETADTNFKAFLSDADIEAGRDSLSDTEYGFTAAQVAAGMQNLWRTIYNMETGQFPTWTAGKMATIDTVYDNAVVRPCESLSGSAAAIASAEAAPGIADAEATATHYADIRALTDAFISAAPELCSKEQEDGNWHMICYDKKAQYTASLMWWDPATSADFEYTTPEKRYEASLQLYGPNWTLSIDSTLDVDAAAIAASMGGILY